MPLITSIVLTTSLTVATQPTIVEQAVEAEQLSTLVTAVKAAGLVEALSADGPVTVFAPTNEAFARVDPKVIEYLLSEPGRPELGRILLHHVVPGRLDAATLVGTSEVTTLAGTTLSLATARDRLLVDDAVVQAADIGASNGIIHTIDRVMLPPVQQSPLEILLVKAIERGVPLFNNNSPEGCAAVYATALEAVVSAEGFGLDKMVRDTIADRLREIEQNRDATEQAWAYRRIMDALLRERMEVDARTPVDRVLFGFQDPGSVEVFDIVLDGVMGGRSSGRIRAGDGTLIFDGETSLRNNGGFSSMRAPVPSGGCDGADALRVRIKGDGRTWIIGTRSGRSFGGESYWTRFDTVNDRWMDVVIPIAEMERTSFGQALRGRISPEQVRGIEFYMYDKKAGPFRLEIDSIEAISTGDTGDQA